MAAPRLASLLGIMILLPACRLEVREPVGSARAGDVEAVQGAVRAAYAAFGAADSLALDTLLLPAATVARTAADTGYLVGWNAPPGPGTPRGPDATLRVVRIEARPDAETAVARVTIASRPAGSVTEREASDVLTFVRRDGAWRVAHLVLGSWRGRPAS